MVAAVHPIIVSSGRRRHLPISYLYRVVLYRLKLSQKHAVSTGQKQASLVIEEWMSLYEALTNEGMKILLEKTLYAVFNILENDLSGCKYIEGNLSMKVSRKGTTISGLEADWLEMTTYYYKQGFSLIDSFIHWEMLRGEQTPKSLDGLFVYEDEAPRVTASKNRGNDAIIVEQWTVFEGSDIKADYGPLLHTLAEFGWLLTCVIPTPIIRHNRPFVNEEKMSAANRSLGLQGPGTRMDGERTAEELYLSSSKPYWNKESHQEFGSFPGFSSGDSMLRDLDDLQFDQEEGVTQVTCM
ncbi:hypothetical protein GDO78_013568 [Eleutherodactylus coqui]|uniref:Raftlin-2 n=1 Tax=Eleutherodactylus coqui TaxID=57060 RepID=A0A8J6JX83_ELECQ|nr:hypothetical protein GDO78_013568 [Eleutherodactylus coqui]